MPLNVAGLKELVSKALVPAKENLIEHGRVLPMLILLDANGRQKTIPVPDKLQVGRIIKKEKPDSFIYLSEVWIREDITNEERQLTKSREGWAEISKRMQAGRMLGASESPNRREAIMLVGGTRTLRVSLQQRFHRDQGKVEFDDLAEMSDLKIGDSLVDWDEDAEDNPARWLTTAPVGGRIIRFNEFEIWIPEGWRMNWEPNDQDPNRSPVWYREKNPNGGLRLRFFINKPSPNEPRDVWKEAKAEVEKRRSVPDLTDVDLDESRKMPILRWTQQIVSTETNQPWIAHVFKVFDNKGSAWIIFQHSSDKNHSDLQDELASVKEIANRFSRLCLRFRFECDSNQLNRIGWLIKGRIT